MLARLLENLLIGIFNRHADGRARASSGQSQTPPLPELPADYAVVGHVIPAPQTERPSERAPKTDGDAASDASDVVALSPETRLRHLYILGATGTGKTNLLLRLIESDIANRRAFCVIDLRGDLVDRILLRLAAADSPEEWRERLLLMDLRDGGHSVGFNPLQGEGDVYDRALHLLSVLKSQSDSWGVQLEETLRNCLIALAETGWTLLEIEPLLASKAFRTQVLQQVRDSRVRSFFERYDALSAANQSTWSLAVLNKVTPLLSLPTLRHTFGQRQGLPFRRLIDQQPGLIVLAALAVDRLHEAAHLAGGLLVSSFQSAIMSRGDIPEAQRIPVQLYIDEFECMASDRFQTIVAEGRRFRLGLTLSHQNLSQLKPDLRHVLRNNVQTQAYFQTGALDAAELVREIGGQGAEDVRQTLMSQPVGQAYLIRRSQPSVRMRVLHSRDPAVTADRVQAVRAASLSTYAKPQAHIAAELAQRERQWNDTSSPTATTASPVASTYEIRHSKTETFAPQPRASKMETSKGKTSGAETSTGETPKSKTLKPKVPKSKTPKQHAPKPKPDLAAPEDNEVER